MDELLDSGDSVRNRYAHLLLAATPSTASFLYLVELAEEDQALGAQAETSLRSYTNLRYLGVLGELLGSSQAEVQYHAVRLTQLSAERNLGAPYQSFEQRDPNFGGVRQPSAQQTYAAYAELRPQLLALVESPYTDPSLRQQAQGILQQIDQALKTGGTF